MLCFLRSISFFTPQAPHSKQRQREDSLQKHITDASRNAKTNLAKKLAAFSAQLTLRYVRKKTQDRLQTYNACSFGLRKQEKKHNKWAIQSFHFILKYNSAPFNFFPLFRIVHPSKALDPLASSPRGFNVKWVTVFYLMICLFSLKLSLPQISQKIQYLIYFLL